MESIFNLLNSPTKRARRTMIYGQPGVGKSGLGSRWKGRVAFITTEDGLRDIEGVSAWPIVTVLGDMLRRKAIPEGKTPSLMALISGIAAAKGPLPFDTLVIDTIDGLHHLVVEYVSEVYTDQERGYGKDVGLFADAWKAILNALEWMNLNRGLEIVLLAHSQIEKFNDPLGESYNFYSPRLHAKSSALVCDWCDEVFFYNYCTMVIAKDEGFNRTRNVAVEAGQRSLFTAKRPGYVAKSRLANVPEEIPVLKTSTYHELIGQYLPTTPTVPSVAG